MSVTGINYNDNNDIITYENVYVTYDNCNKNKIFDSGNFIKDWFNSYKFIIENLSEIEYAFSNSSSVDHFIMDTDLYDSAYLNYKTKELEYEYSEGLMEFFVEKNTKPTWKELKEICK